MPSRSRLYCTAALAALLGLLGFQVVGGMLAVMAQVVGLTHGGVTMVLTTIAQAVVFVPVALACRDLCRMRGEYLHPPHFDLPLSMFAGIVLLFLVQSVYGVWDALLRGLEIDLRPSDTGWISEAPLALRVICTGLIIPVIEEFFFRGALLPALQKATGRKWLPCVAVGLLFGMVHGNLLSLPSLVVGGILMGVVVTLTGNVWTGAAMHSAYNLTVLLISNLPRSAVSDAPAVPVSVADELVVWLVVCGIVGAIMAGLLTACHYTAPRAHRNKIPQGEGPGRRRWMVVAWAPAFLLAAGLLALGQFL